ncbi:MAG: C25 family cysteine peptidase [Pyrinomonadaceae bacterium]
MRKTASLALLLSLSLAAVSPIFAQRSSDDSGTMKVSARTSFDRLSAITDGSGVLVRWQMKVENNVAGYNVYRIGSGSRELVTRHTILGSSARTRAAALGEEYEFFDVDGQAGSRYVVEGLPMGGGRFSSKEFTAIEVKSLEAEVGRSSDVYITAANSKNSEIENRTSALTSELRDLVSLYEQEPDPVNQRWVASQPGVKISVKKDGFYRVSAAELQSANFPVNGDSSKWRLFMNGNEQAIIVGPNHQYIDFYGKGLDNPETDTRVYYLIADTVAGKRIGSKVLRQVPGAAASASYSVEAVKKERFNYLWEVRNGTDDNYFGSVFSDVTIPINVNVSGVDFSVPTTSISINLRGFSETFHNVTAKINGHELPLITQFGLVYYWGNFTIPTNYLVEGTNVLELTSGAGSDKSLFDFVSVKYARKYSADQDKISFYAPGAKKFDITGFSTSNVRVFDTTFDGNPVLISNVSMVNTGSDFTAKVPSGRMMVGYAVEDSALLQATAITENLPSTLSAVQNSADMVIVSYSSPSFLNAAEAWATYRRSSAGGRFTVKVVSIDDVFDEFSYGSASEEALRSFFGHANDEWTLKPKYVLLIGDASYDKRNYQGLGKNDLVPSKFVDLIKTESSSDDAVVDFNDDGFAELAIGRIPARTAAQVNAALAKTIDYEANQQSFSRGVLFAHDRPLDYDFEGVNISLSQALPPGTPISMVGVDDSNAHAQLVERMNDGKMLVNYAGHGSTGLWANSDFFTMNQVSELTNAAHPSFYSMLSCLNGYFTMPDRDTLSETLLFSQTGGAAAAWASTGETTPDIQEVMAQRFFDQMVIGPHNRVGDLVRDAKSVITQGRDVRLSWVLIGDPALRIP